MTKGNTDIAKFQRRGLRREDAAAYVGVSPTKFDEWVRRGRWGNPFVVHHPGSEIGRPMSAKVAVASFKSMVEKEGAWFPVPLPWPKGKIPAQLTTVEDVKQELRGKNLACVCHLCEVHKRSGLPLGTECADCAPCHSTVLLEIANK